jgi:hypothetical protein
VITFATTDLYIQQINIMANEAYKIIKIHMENTYKEFIQDKQEKS